MGSVMEEGLTRFTTLKSRRRRTHHLFRDASSADASTKAHEGNSTPTDCRVVYDVSRRGLKGCPKNEEKRTDDTIMCKEKKCTRGGF